MIKLTFGSKHLTITSLANTDLPDFTVITGRNGTGKSQLLEAVKQGAVKVNGVSLDEIGFINQRDFSIQNGATETNIGLLTNLQSLFTNLENMFKQSLTNSSSLKLSEEERNTIYQTAERAGKPAYLLIANDFEPGDHGAAHILERILLFIDQQFELHGTRTGHRNFYENLFIKTGKLPDDVTLADVQSIKFSDNYDGGVLPQQLQLTILQYAKLRKTNDSNRLLNKHSGRSYEVLTDEQFEAEYGKKPWEVINSLLGAVDSFKYKLDFDENTFKPESDPLTIQFIKRDGSDDIKVPITSLSSGEKALVALVIALYSATADKKFPKLLLLDEIDATLHPSMTSIFLDLIQQNLVKTLGMKVILVTHSPSVVALAPEAAIHTMQTNTDERVVKTGKQEALNQLTEGFIALTEEETAASLKFSFKDAPKDLIFFEGPSDVIYIRHVDNKNGKSLSKDFDITFAGGSPQLRNLWNLLKGADAAGGFTHGKSATLIYDCDEKVRHEVNAHHSQWNLKREEANPIANGIENLLGQDFIQRAYTANPDFFYKREGEMLVNDAYKMDLASWFEENANDNDMVSFIEVIEHIKSTAKRTA